MGIGRDDARAAQAADELLVPLAEPTVLLGRKSVLAADGVALVVLEHHHAMLGCPLGPHDGMPGRLRLGRLDGQFSFASSRLREVYQLKNRRRGV